MTKREKIIVIIGICIAVGAYFIGFLRQYEDYLPTVGVDTEQNKYYMYYTMPLDKETAVYWFDWATYEYHQYYIDVCQPTGDILEYHQDAQKMYQDMKDIFLEFDAKWGDFGSTWER